MTMILRVVRWIVRLALAVLIAQWVVLLWLLISAYRLGGKRSLYGVFMHASGPSHFLSTSWDDVQDTYLLVIVLLLITWGLREVHAVLTKSIRRRSLTR
jgi:glycerol uptake facilitator-like aquaporin